MSNGKNSNSDKFNFLASIRTPLVKALGEEAARENRTRNAQLEYILQQRFPDAVEEAIPVEAVKSPRPRKTSRRETAAA